ncbi:tRNA (adenosine(37)-N6)-threonylcarbamoyltransferase complex ATPase subunit type 1 TsaE [Rhodoblastus acidophilus]|uniref:tRNA threonylcarbamoyladenosine biosynthesis protein TsaE n=1 Tax=Candidatus Rhodoblastus alkanivorans TaxID=2954117 RepID=A0ABS9Z3P9_9HYPH|nr:tRNA (adenosine(37)-N6)-threonylcarbamoyltransferase complex ATPase subunit type 1 TsaE [Candidatus Rhodoblastus alkanivorans]MCI4679742.1 tRNA (adenosine(37)-N6)-threonylcarbamoyltransferase complex ATPase subunit type 1 TsaE [Candidatus Rhodoblastus alkanivorans]MCI4681980.1 tRNA (adenosine(37)-N6)-threonylcarbamoyltransferase complex ATPase subunit type 1 TsaE [Candidatus Rhodoblastus alkanivorans]MDI4643031.1 tRNA (adenosine(37)-N6)-threonylcarbamoyltransferase complex ATPase subunit type
MSEPIWRVELPDEAATRALAQEVAGMVGAGDLVTLSGDLGAGKTTFARALIRGLAGDSELEVPSPTFTLMQVYGAEAFPIVHADLYRVKDPSELAELGWDEAAEGALVIVEWAERAGSALSADRLDVALYADMKRGPDYRRAEIVGHGDAASRLIRLRGAQNLLERCGWDDAEREHMQGDASTRAYEMLIKPDGDKAVLMIMPPRTDGPPVKGGKPYSAIAHLAENIRPFIAMDEALIAQGFSAPRLFAADFAAGLAVLEYLGDEGMVGEGGPRPERYSEAIRLLAQLHGRSLPEEIAFSGGTYRLPHYDLDAFLIEVELLLEWYAPHILGVQLASGARAQFENAWRALLAGPVAAPTTWTLRDYHSPNLLWLANRSGPQRVGLLDFQDAVLGPPAYDLVSLLQDARVTVPDELELKLLGAYAFIRKNAEENFDVAAFTTSYAIMGAQRACKILGIFARLDRRDGKPAYLAHMPRVKNYLKKDLGHPALADLKAWFDQYLPLLFAEEAVA